MSFTYDDAKQRKRPSVDIDFWSPGYHGAVTAISASADNPVVRPEFWLGRQWQLE